MTTIPWISPRGERLSFESHAKDSPWSERAGIYMFCARGLKGILWPKYIGQANNLKQRLCSHERWEEAVRLGCSVVLATLIPTQAERDRLELLLIRDLHPQLNNQLRAALLPPPMNLGFGSFRTS